MYLEQFEFDIRCEWGETGVAKHASHTDVFIIADVLSFTTSVDVAVSRGALIYPYRWRDDSSVAFAESLGAILAKSKREAGYSLSPASLLEIPPGTRLVTPSPNGSTLSTLTNDIPTFAGCLRNAQTVAHAAQKIGKRISMIPAGEKWQDGSLRVAIEDWIGAGAIIGYLQGTCSPEAQLATNAFASVCANLLGTLQSSVSGKELIEKGFPRDVELAAELNVSTCAPRLMTGAFVQG